jgi:EAL domain-containing protein (putative c-di-GMP-specific phosphodiesterase class I)
MSVLAAIEKDALMIANHSVGTNRQTRAIVELIVKLGVALDLNIIAEGVETQAQTEILMQLGCSAIQGYHFARPLSGSDATRALAAIHDQPN